MMTSNRVSRLSRHELAAYLSGKGVSPQGVRSVRENGITGEMLVDFCEDDIRDAFSVFKDRFVVRKVIRETKSNNQSNKFDPYPGMSKLPTDGKVTQGHSGPLLPTRDPGSVGKMVNHTFPMVAQAPIELTQRVDAPMTPGISFQTASHVIHDNQTRPFPVSLRKAEGVVSTGLQSVDLKKNVDIKTESRVRSPTVSSTVEDSHKRQGDKTCTSSYEQKTMHNVNIIDFTQGNRIRQPSIGTSPLPGISFNVSPAGGAKSLPFCIEPMQMDLITIDERNRIQKYTGDQLLAKKGLRGRPSEAQHLGALAIRNAAQAANIWETAPLMRDISEQSMKKFKEYLQSFAPQMVGRMDVVLGRLREALQNRRKYLLDRDSGKRATVQSRYRLGSVEQIVNTQKANEEKTGTDESNKGKTKIKIEDAGSLIDLTE